MLRLIISLLVVGFTGGAHASSDYPFGASALAMQGNNVLVAGSDDGKIGILSLLPDGTLDKAFGAEGRAIFDLTPNCEHARTIWPLPNGGFLVGGSRGYSNGCPRPEQFFGGYIARFTADGKPDKQFGTDGFVTFDEPKASLNVIRVIGLPDGSVLYSGERSDETPSAYGSSFGQTFIGKLTPTGTPDTTFGKNGIALSKMCADLYPCRANIKGMELVDNGTAVVVGGAKFIGNITYYAEKYDLTGQPFAGFGKGGRTEVVLGGFGRGAETMTVDGNGAIYLGGYGGNEGIKIVKLDAQGKVDTTFGNQGLTTVKYPDTSTHQLLSVKVRNGYIFALAQLFCNEPSQRKCGPQKWSLAPALVRLDATGKVDTTFATNGFQIVTDSSVSLGNSMMFLPNDSLLVATAGGFTNFTVGKVEWGGQLDTSYGKNGFVNFDLN